MSRATKDEGSSHVVLPFDVLPLGVVLVPLDFFPPVGVLSLSRAGTPSQRRRGRKSDAKKNGKEMMMGRSQKTVVSSSSTWNKKL